MQTRSQTISRSIVEVSKPSAINIQTTQRPIRSTRTTTLVSAEQPRRSPRMLQRDSMGIPRVEYAEFANEEEITFEPKPKTFTRQVSPRYEVDIDFDESSRAWRANKRSIGQGSFAYTETRQKVREEAAEHVRRSSRLAEKPVSSYA